MTQAGTVLTVTIHGSVTVLTVQIEGHRKQITLPRVTSVVPGDAFKIEDAPITLPIPLRCEQ